MSNLPNSPGEAPKAPKAAAVGFLSGAVYGGVSLAIGHPLDTLKTRMQAQDILVRPSTVPCKQLGIRTAFLDVLSQFGFRGLYRGALPPLLGSSLLRATQFGVFEAVRTALGYSAQTSLNRVKTDGDEHHFMDDARPLTILTVDWRIWAAGGCAGLARALIECPLEVAKTRRQVGLSWRFDSSLFRGLTVNSVRNVGLLSIFFVLVDVSHRYSIPDGWRPFVTGSVCSTLAWTLIWPLDVVKSQIQARASSSAGSCMSIVSQVRGYYQTHGLRGFTRGFVPGASRSLIANGLSMVAYVQTQKFLDEHL